MFSFARCMNTTRKIKSIHSIYFITLFYSQHTEYSDDHAITEHLHGAITDAVDAVDSISAMQNVLAGRTERRRDLHCDRFATALAGVVEDRQRENFSMEVHSDVALHLQREVMQHLSYRRTLTDNNNNNKAH